MMKKRTKKLNLVKADVRSLAAVNGSGGGTNTPFLSAAWCSEATAKVTCPSLPAECAASAHC